MGILAVTISSLWSLDLVIKALKAPVMIGALPIGIFQAVLIFGVMLYYFDRPFFRLVTFLTEKLSLRIFIFLMVIILALISSVVSVIVTAVLMSEIITALKMGRLDKMRLVVLTCFAIGLGAVLTPLGEPLSTILIQKLSGQPYSAGFSFPFAHFAVYVIPGVIFLAIFAAIWLGKKTLSDAQEGKTKELERLPGVLMRAVKVFIFVVALVLLGEGLKPLVVWYLIKVPSYGLYWINTLSAVLDNATLTAVEITVDLSLSQIISVTMALLVAGGILVPGNIPNIVASGRLKISMREWAKTGIPLGAALLVVYFLVLIPVIFG
jgi:predicted cation transporter